MTDEIARIKQKVERKDKRSILTFLVFLALSTALWLLIKLSENYTTQAVFRVQLEEVPADKWISSPEQTVKLSLDIDGFHTLRLSMIRETKRVVAIPLDGIPYRLENGNTYSFGSQYVAEKIAERLDVNTSDLTMNEAKFYFNMEPLMSKVVPVELCSDIKTARQYGIYGIPILEPAYVTVFGPEEILDTVKSVKTMLLAKSNANQDFSETVDLDLLDGQIQSTTKSVEASVKIQKFTEVDVSVPITFSDSLNLRLFPEAVTVKCLVAIKDYAILVPENFNVQIDMGQLKALQPLLDVRLVSCPKNVQVLETKPDKVEYIIVQ